VTTLQFYVILETLGGSVDIMAQQYTLKVGCLSEYINYIGFTSPAAPTIKEVGVSGTSVAAFT